MRSTKNESNSILDTSYQTNKGIRFENYTSRKFNFQNGDGPNVISYIEPKKYVFKHTSIKVRKEKIDNINELGKNNIPAANQYYPKFNYVLPMTKSGKEIILLYKLLVVKYNKIPMKNNRYIIQKLWHSHDVSIGYKTVKLNEVADAY